MFRTFVIRNDYHVTLFVYSIRRKMHYLHYMPTLPILSFYIGRVEGCNWYRHLSRNCDVWRLPLGTDPGKLNITN